MTRSAQAPLLRQGGAVQLPLEHRPTGASRRSLVVVLGFLVAAGLALVGQRWLSEGTYLGRWRCAAGGPGGVLLLIL